MGPLQKALTRAIQRQWVLEVPGLLPHIAAALEHAGGFKPDEEIDRGQAGESQGKRQLREACQNALDKVGDHHPASVHLKVILKLYPHGPAEK